MKAPKVIKLDMERIRAVIRGWDRTNKRTSTRRTK